MASSVIISAPNAVLGIPRDVWGINSGVTEAADSTCSCTGWTFAHGDGVNKVFELPSLVSSLTALYRRDWQGNVALSASARTNYIPKSQPTVADFLAKSATIADATVGAPLAGAAIHYPAASQFDYSIQDCGLGIVDPIVSAYVIMDDGGAPVLGSSALTGDFLPYVNNGSSEATEDMLVVSLGGGLYRVSARWIGTTTGANCGFYRHATQSGRGFNIFGRMVEPSNGRTAPTSYIPTTTAPVALTDYAATGSTITLAEAPLWGSDLSVDADLVPHSCLHGGE